MKKLIALVLSVILILTGCHAGVSQAEYNKLVKELDEARKTIEELENKIEKLEPSADNTNNSSDNGNADKDSPILIVNQEATGTKHGFSYARFTVKNNSGAKINTLTLNIKILDRNGVVLATTHPQDPVVLDHGESIVIEALTHEAGAYSMKLDGYTFYTGTGHDGEYIQGHFDIAEELVLK